MVRRTWLCTRKEPRKPQRGGRPGRGSPYQEEGGPPPPIDPHSIVGHWLVLGGAGQEDTPAEVLNDGRVLFNGKDYGKAFHIKPTKVPMLCTVLTVVQPSGRAI